MGPGASVQRGASLFYRDGLFSMVTCRENVPSFNKFPESEYISSCPKSWFGFSHTILQESPNGLSGQPKIVPSRAFVGEPEAKEDRQGFCSFGIILSSFR